MRRVSGIFEAFTSFRNLLSAYRKARRGETVELHPEALERIKKCRGFIEERIVAKEIMYGVNTGIGEFSEVVLDDDQVRQFQRYLVYNHAAGIGDPLPPEVVDEILSIFKDVSEDIINPINWNNWK